MLKHCHPSVRTRRVAYLLQSRDPAADESGGAIAVPTMNHAGSYTHLSLAQHRTSRARRSNCGHRATVRVATIAQLRSRPSDSEHQAAVLLPPALPSDTHRIGGPLIRRWPSRLLPVTLPTRLARALRAWSADAARHG